MCLCVREAKQNPRRKCSHRSPLVSITEEAEWRKGLELEAAERTTNSPNGTDRMEVYVIIVHKGKIVTILQIFVRRTLFSSNCCHPLRGFQGSVNSWSEEKRRDFFSAKFFFLMSYFFASLFPDSSVCPCKYSVRGYSEWFCVSVTTRLPSPSLKVTSVVSQPGHY